MVGRNIDCPSVHPAPNAFGAESAGEAADNISVLRQWRSGHSSLGQRPKDLCNAKARFIPPPFWSSIGAMPQSLSKVILHIVFSTKNREPWLDSDIQPRMHVYLATICRDLGG